MKVSSFLQIKQYSANTPYYIGALVLLLSAIVTAHFFPDVSILRFLSESQSAQRFVFLVTVLLVTALGIHVSLLASKLRHLQSRHDVENHAALHDVLTGSANRRQFDRQLHQLISEQDHTHALLMIDLDRFKPVNDLYGHAAGDALLKAISAGFRRTVRNGDMVARLGGDEFAILLRDRNISSAEQTALDILQFVSKHRLNWEGQRLSVGASIGVMLIDPGGATSAQLLAAADDALYAAKEAGRNTVFVAEKSVDDSQKPTLRQLTANIELAISTNRSHLPDDGSAQELNARLLLQTAVDKQSDRRRADGARRRHDIKHWVYIEPSTTGDALSPGMNTREWVFQASAHQDGGADFARWIMGMTLHCASRLDPVLLDKTDFIIPLPAQALVAVPTLAEELMRCNALSRLPLRHITFVMHGLERVYTQASFQSACQRLQVSESKLALELQIDSLEVLSPLQCITIDELHAGREIIRKIKPNANENKTLDALLAITNHLEMALVAPCVESQFANDFLANSGVRRLGQFSPDNTYSLASVMETLNNTIA